MPFRVRLGMTYLKNAVALLFPIGFCRKYFCINTGR